MRDKREAECGGGGGGSLRPPWYIRWWSLRAYLFLNILAQSEQRTAGLLKCTRSMCFHRLRRHEMSFPHSWQECGNELGGSGGEEPARSPPQRASARMSPLRSIRWSLLMSPRRSSGGSMRGSIRGSGRRSYLRSCLRSSQGKGRSTSSGPPLPATLQVKG